MFFIGSKGRQLIILSFPTRRSSDLAWPRASIKARVRSISLIWIISEMLRTDRKSTRLNSSHTVNSYAVICLKKKKRRNNISNIILSQHKGEYSKILVLVDGSQPSIN